MHSEDDNVAFIARLRAGSLDQLADRLQDEWDNGFQVAAVGWSDLRAIADLPSPAVDPEERDLPYYEDVRDLLDEMLGTRRAEEVADMLTAAVLITRPAVNRNALVDVLTTADEDLHNEHGGDGALMNRNYLEYLADRLIAAGAIAGTS